MTSDKTLFSPQEKLDQETRASWENMKGTFLEETVEQMMLAGSSAEEFKAWDLWQHLHSMVESIRRGEALSPAEAESPDGKVAAIVAAWMQEQWVSYRDGSLKRITSSH